MISTQSTKCSQQWSVVRRRCRVLDAGQLGEEVARRETKCEVNRKRIERKVGLCVCVCMVAAARRDDAPRPPCTHKHTHSHLASCELVDRSARCCIRSDRSPTKHPSMHSDGAMVSKPVQLVNPGRSTSCQAYPRRRPRRLHGT